MNIFLHELDFLCDVILQRLQFNITRLIQVTHLHSSKFSTKVNPSLRQYCILYPAFNIFTHCLFNIFDIFSFGMYVLIKHKILYCYLLKNFNGSKDF